MLAGLAATQQCFDACGVYGGLLPSDLDGATPPPAGSPNYVLNFGDEHAEHLEVPRRLGDARRNSTFTGPTTIPVAAFTAACSGGGACIPQPGTAQTGSTRSATG